MATMSMNKAIHGAVRRDLRRFLEATASFSDGDTKRAAALGCAWDNFDTQLTHHHEGEHEIAWPAMLALGITQAQLDGFDAEHDTMSQALGKARLAMAAFRRSGAKADADAVHTAVSDLQSVTETHLGHEEDAVEQLMLDKADDPIIKDMGRKFSKVSPAVGGVFFNWVRDGATADELAAIERDIPKPVLAIIGGVFGRSYRKNIAPVWA
ncbi:hemerythrin domain-containing protein [Nocardioides marmorisolisilvae]|uniref:Hemerythrin domain-containing protein n=1 Tax=Nocardioides marmorisolisilvae TaxID=1542737 RepID=A0A3N0DZ11_9ACTN|nr:hemerythrin domain-containing protein [Nocardioides marmorisolisilvae]RNL80845.1 hemerythrin domain-containing protein [Nocardioides marmorisolisilvae]